MAGRHGIAQINGVTTGTAIKTMIQLVAAANHAIKITEVGIGFHGITATNEPILVQLIRQTDAGTMSASTPVKADDSIADSFDTTQRHTATVEPTSTAIVRSWAIHPQTGLVYQPSPDTPIVVGAGDRLGLVVTAANAVDADAYMAFEE